MTLPLLLLLLVADADADDVSEEKQGKQEEYRNRRCGLQGVANLSS